MRGRFPVRQTRNGAHQPLAVMAYTLGLGIQNHQQSIPLLHGRSHTLLQSFLFFLGHHRLVDHYFYVMILVTVQLHSVNDFLDFSVNPHIQIAFLAHLLEKFLIMSLTGPHQRCQDENTFSFIIAVNQIQNLLFRILHHLLTGEIGISRTCPGIQQTEIIINLSSCPYGRTGILVCGLLFDGDDRTQSRNLIHIRPFHTAQEVAGICRECFDITALSLGKDCIECQG